MNPDFDGQSSNPGKLVDVLAAGLAEADEGDLVASAAAAGDDLAANAADLRARFLSRVEAARATTRLSEESTQAGPEGEAPRADADADADANPAGDADPDADPDEPLRIGRYPILRRVGAGGMGVVFAAYDELLDRKLAIKVLHRHVWDEDGRRHERLLREAQAMARVAHPNVITVHEVGMARGQLFVAMEFVEGVTLKQWLGDAQRPWREVVAVFVQIAEGLAALHDAGLVHRDVKPANVLLGEDGRARVLDLGLVGAEPSETGTGTGRGTQTQTAPPRLESSSSLNRIEGPLTRTGERLGTPAYMSREQFMGLEPTPASDVFSFSVMLFEALYGVHPFKSLTYYELQAKVIGGELNPPPSSHSVPAWLASLVRRGLESEPSARPDSMRTYAAALAKDPRRVRRRWLGTLALTFATAVGATAITRAQQTLPPPSCEGGSESVAEVWGPTQAEAIRAAMQATGRSYAEALAARVTDDLDDYTQAWASSHRQACLDHAEGQHSAQLLDRRMACLARRRQALVETVALLAEADAAMLENAGQMVARLPRIDACSDLAALELRAVPTSLAAQELEARLVRVDTLANAGRLDEASALADTLAAEAEALELPATLARILLSEARASIILRRDDDGTVALLDRSLSLAITEQLDPLAAEAMIRRMYLRGIMPGRSELVLADLPIAEAMVERAGDELELRALLLNNSGVIRLAAGDRVAARADFERALVLKERLFGPTHLEVALGLANLGMLAETEAARRELHGRMLDIYTERLGPEHPWALDAALLAAHHTADPEQAGASLRELCPRLEAIGAGPIAGECELARGRLADLRGHPAVAQRAFSAARRLLELPPGASTVVLDAYLVLSVGPEGPAPAEAEAAAAALRAELADSAPDAAVIETSAWWLLLERAERRLALARLLGFLGSGPEAIAQLERALVELDAIRGDAPPLERERLLAACRGALALARSATDPRDPRAFAEAAAARNYYERWPAAYARRLDELDALPAPPSVSNPPTSNPPTPPTTDGTP